MLSEVKSVTATRSGRAQQRSAGAVTFFPANRRAYRPKLADSSSDNGPADRLGMRAPSGDGDANGTRCY